jgi:peroxiredoxin Q/BCP
MTLQQGDPLPEFKLQNQDGETVNSDRIENALIYFYPKASTSGCTKQACNFRDNIKQLENTGITVYGISTDTVEKQKEFHDNNDLNFDLLADPDHEVAEKFGVFRKMLRVAERTTFHVKDGEIVKVFEKVDPGEHINEVIDYLND